MGIPKIILPARIQSLKLQVIWAAPSKFGTYRLCEQRRFRRACASAQSRQNLRCSLIQAVSQEEPSDREPDPWLLRMAGHAQLKFVMTECSKTQIRLTGPIFSFTKSLKTALMFLQSIITSCHCVISSNVFCTCNSVFRTWKSQEKRINIRIMCTPFHPYD